MSTPAVVDLRVTSRCDMDCNFCHGAPKGMGEASLSDFLDALQLLRRCGVERLVISGGEPLVRRDTPEIIGAAFDLGFQVYLSTDGFGYPDRYDKIKDYIDWLGMPLDGSTDQLNVRMSRSSRGFGRIQHILTDFYKSRPSHRVKVGTVVSSVNAADILNIGAFLFDGKERHSPDVWRLYQFVARGEGRYSQQTHSISAAEFNRIASTAKEHFGDRVSSLSNTDHDFSYFFVDPDLTLKTAMGETFPYLGNLMEMTDLELLSVFERKYEIIVRSTSNREWLSSK